MCFWVGGEDFVVGEAIEVIYSEVYFAVGSGNLVGELVANVGVLAEIVFPLVLLGEGEFYFLFLQLSHKGGEVHLVKEQTQNIKITTPEDFYYLRSMLELEENRVIFGL